MTSPAAEPLISRSPADTWAIAARLLASLPPSPTRGVVIALHGDLGTGKTCFVQGLAMALGIHHPVTSPTFTLVNEYAGARPLYHIDLYRLDDPDQTLDIGLEEYLEGDGITAIEWAERAGNLLPAHTIHIWLTALPESTDRSVLIVKPA